ncbi:tRNA dimethylallyltransferase [Clostridia bacterium]|nr:tRNA dimethylallyltransferase [Clostridia bacterium]
MSQQEKIPVIAVVGPTAGGKTALAVQLALRYGGEVVNADSMQVYAEMEIATAQPTERERGGVPHRLFGFIPPSQRFSVYDYVTVAAAEIDDIVKVGRVPVLCGGSGLYADTLLNGISLPKTKADPAYRAELYAIAAGEQGGAALLARLREVDPALAARLHSNDVKRIVRGLEVWHTEGVTLSELSRESRAKPSRYAPVYIGVNRTSRELLRDRIDRRVDAMVAGGLVSEARRFFDKYGTDGSLTSAQAIGHKELRPYIYGGVGLDECVGRIKTVTRQYAKRQMTWFRRNDDINWVYVDEFVNNDEILRYCENVIDSYGIIL